MRSTPWRTSRPADSRSRLCRRLAVVVTLLPQHGRLDLAASGSVGYQLGPPQLSPRTKTRRERSRDRARPAEDLGAFLLYHQGDRETAVAAARRPSLWAKASGCTVMGYGRRMTALALSFPTLHAPDGVSPWDAERLEAWLGSGAPGHGARCAGRFVLSVWSSYREWQCGRFDLHEALGCWDDEHHRAFLAWILRPWWP